MPLGAVLMNACPFQLRRIALAGAALTADVVLKWALAPIWREMIGSAAGW